MSTRFRLGPADVVRVAGAGLRARPLRVFLSALGIAIGIAAMIAVVGISTSSRAELDRTLERLGTNLLTVGPGNKMFTGDRAALPAESVAMIDRIGPVLSATATARLSGTHVYRSDRIPAGQTGSIAVLASYLDLLGERWFTVVGVLDPVELAPELDTAALIGWPAAETYLGFDGHPTTVYSRAREDQVGAVQKVLAATANPSAPAEVVVSRPSEALAAKDATDRAWNGLSLGLGAVALLVGGVGVANTMVISVLERRSEIGLRRSLGATRGQIRTQFLAESLLLSTLGGTGGIALGILVTSVYAITQGWPTVVPAWASVGGLLATLAIGAAAGLFPAVRAARLAPTEALAAT